MSNLFRLNSTDFLRGITNAVIGAVILALAGVVQTTGFDVFSADWGNILTIAFNAAFTVFIGYIGGKFTQDSNGNYFGVWGGK